MKRENTGRSNSATASKTKKSNAQSEEEMREMEDSAFHQFFVEQLQDIYYAEKALVKNLPKMAKKATSDQLREAIENHLEETEGQVEKLERVFESIGEKAKAKKCEAMQGLLEEATEVMKDTENGSMVRDVAIIAAAQKVEHYEIASYGTLRTLASVMGHTEAEEILSEILEEEKNADETLTGIAEGFVNERASQE